MSETDFLKLKKHDNVETNTEKFDIENYLNGNWDKINENAKKTNKQILQLETEKTKLEKELKEAQEDFYQNSIRGQASGEYIHVEDSSNCRSIIGIGGNHEQEMRSGKNYLNTLAKYKAGEKVTVDGITYIFNEDGSITCNGTATADSVLTFSSNLQTINGSGKKIVGMITGTQVPAKLNILAYTSDWSKNTFELLSSVNKNITINMQENIDYTIFRIIAYKGTTLNNQTIYYQILDTSVNDLTYEQYGASPSPDYQSEIESVGSNVNELDIAAVKDGFLNEKTGEIILNNSWKCSDFIEILNKTYTFGWESSSDYFQVTVCYYDENKKFISGKSYGLRGTFNNTFEVVSNAKYMKIAYSVSVSGESVTREKIKLEKGTVATPYSKYGQGCVKVTKCNKNLYDENNKLMNATINSNGIISTGQDNYLLYFPVKYGHKYIFSTDFSESLTTNIVFGYCNEIPSIGVLSTYNVIPLSNLKNKIFTPIDEKNKYLCIRLNYKTQYNKMSNIQLEENTVSTSFEEHQEQSYIMPVQKEMLEGDYFDFDNEEEVHTWNKLTLNGTENITLNSNYNDCTLFELVKSDCYIPTDTKKYAISNHFISGNKDLLASNNGINMVGLGTSRGRIWINVSNSIVGTSDKLNNFKTLLKSKYDAGTPVVIYYKLATPNRLKFTDEQKAVAKELNNARTYKNVTNITTDSKAILSLDYTKDLETQNQKMQNEIDEIKQLLSTTQTSAMLLDNLQKEVESEVE